jgi:hypothetical protein
MHGDGMGLFRPGRVDGRQRASQRNKGMDEGPDARPWRNSQRRARF